MTSGRAGVRVRTSADLRDDMIVTRRTSGAVSITLSAWLTPGQRLVALGLASGVLEATPRCALVMHVRTGQLLAQAESAADARLRELMDRETLTAEEQADVVELLLLR